jgi:hypothetical protein
MDSVGFHRSGGDAGQADAATDARELETTRPRPTSSYGNDADGGYDHTAGTEVREVEESIDLISSAIKSVQTVRLLCSLTRPTFTLF